MTHAEPARDPRRSPSRRAPVGPRIEPVSCCAISADGCAGAVRFQLQRLEGAVYVEREDIPRHGLRTIQSMAFIDPGGFGRWCDSEPVRFEHPLLHAQLKRAGAKLWDLAPVIAAV